VAVNRKSVQFSARSKSNARRIDFRPLRQRFLIVCEGEKTEPNYFRGFRVPGKILDIRGVGYNTTSLVQEAIRLKDKGDYDQTWCVFDRDSFPAQNFNAAMQLAKNNNINVACSNEAFELWYLLHFDYHQSGISRSDYIEILNRKLGHKYFKNSETIYEELEGYQEVAIRNAERLLSIYDPLILERCNPSTLVHLLVKELLKSSP
jgi:hypothetical protein